jgi:adenosylmethionine-8-amino-7-oxononanoate aminotransferase
VQRVIRRDGLLDNVLARGRQLAEALQARFAAHPYVGDIRGRGLFWGIELVADRATKTPLDPKLRIHARIKANACARGLMVYPMGGTVDGRSGDHVLLAPPFISDAAVITAIVERLGEAIDVATTNVKAVA